MAYHVIRRLTISSSPVITCMLNAGPRISVKLNLSLLSFPGEPTELCKLLSLMSPVRCKTTTGGPGRRPPLGFFASDTSEHSIFAPLPAHAQSLHTDAPQPPLLATRASSSPLSHPFTITSLAHVLQSTDLQAWTFNKAARLVESSVPTMWVYTDWLSSPQCHGSAVTFFPPQGDPTILSCSSPYESSEESEG